MSRAGGGGPGPARSRGLTETLCDPRRYPTRPKSRTLSGVRLTLERGKQTALVGPSGAGKSTLVQLIARFYNLEDGAIALNGTPVEAFSRKQWARAVSIVSQDPVLFHGTVAENIAYGHTGDKTRHEVAEAARAANADDFIRELPEGYETVIGEKGQSLSGGQRQRISIARALLKDSPILILDEATSALDANSEKLVKEALERLQENRMVLTIAHRLSTVVNADEVVVLREGAVVERGTHKELVGSSGLYSELVSAQALI